MFLCYKCGNVSDSANMVYHKEYNELCKKCYKELYDRFKGISVYRFISFQRFREMIESKTLTFSLPSIWEDSFEDVLFKCYLESRSTDLLDEINLHEILAQRDRYYCQCWTLTQESQALWEIYSYGNTSIRVEMDLADLFENGLRIEPVIYAPLSSREEIINMYGPTKYYSPTEIYILHIINNLYEICESEFFFEKIPFPKIQSVKRMSFAIENEVRIFSSAFSMMEESENEMLHNNYVSRVYNNDDNLQTNMPERKAVPFDYGWIKSLLLNPLAPDSVSSEFQEIIKAYKLSSAYLRKSGVFSNHRWLWPW